MGWPDEVDALVGVPTAWPAIVATLEDGFARCHLVAQGSSTPSVAIVNPAREARGTTVRSRATTLPLRDGAVPWIAVSFLRDKSRSTTRRALVRELARVLAPGGTLVVADHNRPRRRVRAALAIVLAPRPRGCAPRAAWRRLAYPTAREISAAGLVIERLRLAAGERVQVVRASRRPA